jgi:glutamate 5-kinase
MQTKTNIASKVADEGLEVIIANGKRDDILIDLLLKEEDIVCTRFVPSDEPATSVKKWIAHSEGFARGEIYLNEGARLAIVEGDEASSVLLVGVTRVEGDFEKDDIVKVMDAEGNQLGVGKTQYKSSDARLNIGKKGKKPIIHYDYLYIF